MRPSCQHWRVLRKRPPPRTRPKTMPSPFVPTLGSSEMKSTCSRDASWLPILSGDQHRAVLQGACGCWLTPAPAQGDAVQLPSCGNSSPKLSATPECAKYAEIRRGGFVQRVMELQHVLANYAAEQSCRSGSTSHNQPPGRGSQPDIDARARFGVCGIMQVQAAHVGAAADFLLARSFWDALIASLPRYRLLGICTGALPALCMCMISDGPGVMCAAWALGSPKH